MNPFGVGTFLLILKLFALGECFREAYVEESSFQCGQRPLANSDEWQDFYYGVGYPGQLPYYGIIYHLKPNRIVEYACGGTLITEKHVITARICATSENGSLLDSGEVFFRIGTRKKNVVHVGYARHRTVSKIHQPVDFNKTSKNELIILELSKKVTFNDYVQTACINPEEGFYNPLTRVVLGWGLPKGNDYLGKYNLRLTDCPSPTFHFNRTLVCGTDRGSAVYLLSRASEIIGIIDCTKIGDNLCDTDNWTGDDFIKVNDYVPWIIHVTNLDHLQKVRKGQDFDPSKQYPDLLPRRNCGNILTERNNSIPQLFEYPWMALIIQNVLDYTGKPIICTGTLISHHYVLTTSSCTADGDLFVRLGEFDRDNDPDCTENDGCAPPYVDYEVAYTVKHQNYVHLQFYPVNNIALIRTKKAVHYDDHIQPVCLPITQELRHTKLGEFVQIGWTSGNLLQKMRVTLVNYTECFYDKRFKTDINFDAVACSNRNNKDDIGSAVGSIVNYNGMRFVQFAMGISTSRVSDYYTLVSYNIGWIIANMKE